MAAYYDLKRSGAQYMFNLIAPNGEKILTSERYTTKQNAENGIASCRVNSPHDARYMRKNSTSGSPYFTLHGGNGEVIGVSEMYSSTSARETGIQSVKTNGPSAPTRDNT
jgi:hypothetical protein